LRRPSSRRSTRRAEVFCWTERFSTSSTKGCRDCDWVRQSSWHCGSARVFSLQGHEYNCDGNGDWRHDYCEKFCDAEDRDRDVDWSYHTGPKDGLYSIGYCNAQVVAAWWQLSKSSVPFRASFYRLIRRVREERENGRSANGQRVESTDYPDGNREDISLNCLTRCRGGDQGTIYNIHAVPVCIADFVGAGLRNSLGSVTGKVYDVAVAEVLQRNPIRCEGISTMVDEVQSDLRWEQNRRRPKRCGRGGLANVASREKIIVVPFNFRHAVQVR